MRKFLFKSILWACLFALLPHSANASTFVGGRTDFRDETIYFVITTRFYDGDHSNNTMCWDGQEINTSGTQGDPAWRGDFKGLIEKLDYIKALGFTAIWITPVVENASGYDYHGYHASNFSKVDHRYESDDVDFQTLIDAVHEKGMKLVLDIVLNHTGNFGEENLCKLFERDWTANQADIDACMTPYTVSDGGVMTDDYADLSSDSQYSTRLAMMKNTDGVNHDTHNYWHHVGNGWNWDDYSRWYGQIAGDCVDLNTENPVVSNYLVECYGKFIEMGVDGFRIDTSGHISPLTFNNAFIPQFTELAETYKSKRSDGQAFFMFGEVCARSQDVIYRNQYNCSPCFYTWTNPKTYDWTTDETLWDDLVVMEGYYGDHTNMNSTLQIGTDYSGTDGIRTSDNAFLSGNSYHTPDYSEYSGFSVIDFAMHRAFQNASGGFSIKYGDSYYNDATYNVVYVDSHDYAPEGVGETMRFSGETSAWAENLDLMFTWRGIPVLYYGSEVEFKKGCVIDNGTNIALSNSGRAYYGGYIEGDVEASDFGEYTATGNALASLTAPLSEHIIRLNKIRMAVPALRKGQYSTDGCSGSVSFKRRYTDSTTDSYALVTISGSSTFTDIENGTYVDCVTGDTQTVTNNTLTATCSGTGNLRVYVLNTDLTSAPGKIGDDGVYMYDTTAAASNQTSYDGTQDDLLDNTEYTYSDGSSSSVEEPEEAIDPSMSEGEQAVFFDNSDSQWSGTIKAWVWNDDTNYTGGTWPGQAATYLGDGIWKWTYTGSSVISGYVIFNNGSSQTSTFEYVNGGYYTTSGYQKTIEGAGEITGSDDDEEDTSDTSTTAEDYTYTYVISYDNPYSWSTVKCYIWNTADNDDGADYAGTWSGSEMTYDETAKTWTYSLTTTCAASELSVIFNNGSSGSDNQTNDLSFASYVTSTTVNMPVNITSVGYATFTPEYAVDLSNETEFKAYTVTADSEGQLTFNQVSTIAASEGVLIESTSGSSLSKYVASTSETVTANSNNNLVGTLSDISSLATTDGDYKNYILYNGSYGLGFYQANNQSLSAGKAYLRIDASTAAKINCFIFNDATGINGIATMENDAPSAYYNLGGQRVTKSYKGVVIANGEKAVRK